MFKDAVSYNRDIRYMISEGRYKGLFSVNIITGRLNLTSDMPPDIPQSFDLEVVATDTGSPQRQGHVVVSIKITGLSGKTMILAGKGITLTVSCRNNTKHAIHVSDIYMLESV